MKYFYIFFILLTSFLACNFRRQIRAPEAIDNMIDAIEKETQEEENLKKWDSHYLKAPPKDSLFVDFKNLSR